MNIFEKLEGLEEDAKTFGLYWANSSMILDQLFSEVAEIKEAIDLEESRDRIQEEIGDLLHATFSLCVFLRLDQEETLRKTVEKFEKRFLKVKDIALSQGYENLKGESIETIMEFWEKAKI
jgi:ATP diphosphatase